MNMPNLPNPSRFCGAPVFRIQSFLIYVLYVAENWNTPARLAALKDAVQRDNEAAGRGLA